MVIKRPRSPQSEQGTKAKSSKPVFTANQGKEWLLAELDTLEQSYKAAVYHVGMIMRFHADVRKAGLAKQVTKAPSHLVIGLARETDKWETTKRRIDYYLRKTYRLTSQSVAPSPELSSQPLPDDMTILSRRSSLVPEQQQPLSAINPLLAAHLKTPLEQGQSSPVPLATAKFEMLQQAYPGPSDLSMFNTPQMQSQPPQSINLTQQTIPDDQLSQLQSFIGGSDLANVGVGVGDMDLSGVDMASLESLFPSGASETPLGDSGAMDLEQLQAFLNQSDPQMQVPVQDQSFGGGRFNAQGQGQEQAQEALSMFTQPTESVPPPQAVAPQQLSQLQQVEQQATSQLQRQQQQVQQAQSQQHQEPQLQQLQQLEQFTQQNQQRTTQQPQNSAAGDALSGLGLDMGNPSDGLQMGPEELELLLAGWQE